VSLSESGVHHMVLTLPFWGLVFPHVLCTPREITCGAPEPHFAAGILDVISFLVYFITFLGIELSAYPINLILEV